MAYPWKMDYVYTTEDAGYQNAHVVTDLKGDRVALDISVNTMVTAKELDGILASIEQDLLQRMRLSLQDDCVLTLIHQTQRYIVTVAGDPPRTVWPLKQVEL